MSLTFLIGFMGAGKSSLGQSAADLLGWTFLDLDDLIVQREGKSIPDLFAERGEGYFRQVETACLQALEFLRSGQYLIATGGGTPCQADNLAWMKAQGQTIYLQVSVKELSRRLRGEAEGRPLLQGKSQEEVTAFIQQKLKEREAFYLQADHLLSGDQLQVEDLVDLLGGGR
jgi:shikimate kinase